MSRPSTVFTTDQCSSSHGVLIEYPKCSIIYRVDCDADVILLQVEQVGGSVSNFGLSAAVTLIASMQMRIVIKTRMTTSLVDGYGSNGQRHCPTRRGV